MKKTLWMIILVFGLLAVNVAQADDITGNVTVLKRDGKKPLKSFANAVVYLEGIETPAPQEPVLMDQKKKTFVPRLLPVVKGQEVQFLNSDRVRHNVFSPHEEEPFDLGRYPKGEYKSLTFNVLGRHRIYCDIHQRMIGDVFVLPNHYFGVTDKKGYFSIKNVPPGEYTLKVWHILGGEYEQPVRLTDGPLEVNLTITSQKFTSQIENHKNKSGYSYKDDDDDY